jgi:hypothetical protein
MIKWRGPRKWEGVRDMIFALNIFLSRVISLLCYPCLRDLCRIQGKIIVVIKTEKRILLPFSSVCKTFRNFNCNSLKFVELARMIRMASWCRAFNPKETRTDNMEIYSSRKSKKNILLDNDITEHENSTP